MECCVGSILPMCVDFLWVGQIGRGGVQQLPMLVTNKVFQ